MQEEVIRTPTTETSPKTGIEAIPQEEDAELSPESKGRQLRPRTATITSDHEEAGKVDPGGQTATATMTSDHDEAGKVHPGG